MKVVKYLMGISLIALFVISVSACSQDSKDTMSKEENNAKIVNVAEKDMNHDGKVYACPSCGVVKDEAGKCPGCGGDLHEMSVEEADEAINHKEHHDGEMKGHDHEMHKDMDGKSIDVTAIDKNHDGKVYQCPMCADQVSDEKGSCAKCGMALEETTVEKAKENLEKAKG